MPFPAWLVEIPNYQDCDLGGKVTMAGVYLCKTNPGLNKMIWSDNSKIFRA